MKNKIFIALLLLSSTLWGQEVGIDTEKPNALLEIASKSPATNNAIIIPRVSALNTRDKKATGLIVFLEKDDTANDKNDRGFYWWNGNAWVPFLSTVSTSINRTITYIQTNNNFVSGGDFSLHNDNTRTLGFNQASLRTQTPQDFSIENGALVIKKAGYYNVNVSVSLFKHLTTSNTTPPNNNNIRDTFDVIVLINGQPTNSKNGNLELKGTQVFPNGLDIGMTIPFAGLLKLDANDKITLRIVKNNGRMRTNARQSRTSIDSNADSSITLQYLGT